MKYKPKFAVRAGNEYFYYIPYGDFPGYAISKLGNIASNKSGAWVHKKNTADPKTGYFIVTLTSTNKTSTYHHRKAKQHTFTIHKLLYSAFVSGRQHSFNEVVDHIDGNKVNNNINNLQLLSRRDNVNKTRKGAIGISIVKSIATDYKTGLFTNQQLHIKYGVSKGTIENIVYGQAYSHETGIPRRYKRKI